MGSLSALKEVGGDAGLPPPPHPGRSIVDQAASHPSPAAVAAEAERLKQEAMDVARRLAGDLPTRLGALSAAATVYDETGNADEALRCWQQVLKLAPNRPDGHNAIGLIALRKGQYEEAVACWRKTLQLDPDLPGVHQRLAHALMGLGQMAEAAAALEQEVKISPKSSRVYYLLGQTRTQLGQFQPARESYEMAIQLNPEELDAYYGLANALARLGHQDQAAAVREKWTRLKAEYWKTHVDLRSNYDDAATMRQTLVGACMLAAGVYAQHRRPGDAELLWARVAELEPNDVQSRMLLSSMYQATSRLADARRVCQQLTQIQPANPAHYLNLGSLEVRLKQGEAAQQTFQKARQLAETAVSQQPTAANYYLLSVASDRTGDRPGALAAIQQALKLAPGNAQYEQIRQLLQRQK